MMNKSARKSAISRRKFLRSGALASVVIGSGAGVSCTTAPTVVSRSKPKAKNIIFMVSDGMSSGTLSIADQYVLWRDGKRSHWMQLYVDNLGQRSLMETASATSIVTDSAAASSAWGCGQRVPNRSLNTDADGNALEPIFVRAKAAGKSTGVAVTVPVTHATPAGFGANNASRHNQAEIAVQYLERQFDVLLGGGHNFFNAESRDDDRDLYADYRREGYAIVRNRAELENLSAARTKVLGTFAGASHPYEIDRLNDPARKETVPSLAEMTRQALDRLSRNPEGFMLHVEGGRVDHAAHANDIGGLVFDQLAFDDAIAVAREFQERNPDTLLIVTTDHGNANPGLLGGGNRGDNTFSRLSQFKGTLANLRLEEDFTYAEVQERFLALTQLEVSREHAVMILGALRGEYQVPFRRMNRPRNILAQVVANHLDVSWIGDGHTSDHVEMFAMGPGSENLNAFIKNYEVFDFMNEAMGIA